MPKTEKDYEELLQLLNKNKVKYCIVGAYAVIFYTRPRYTKDLDIFIEPSVENARKIINALEEFGFKNLNLKTADLTKKGIIVQLGYEPVRIDLITSLSGCSFKKVWQGKVAGNYGKQKVYFIGRQELIKNKKNSGRDTDKIDLKNLSEE